MKLIYVEPQLDLAQRTCQRLLADQAVCWELFHCTSTEQAVQLYREHGPFDAALLNFEVVEATPSAACEPFCQAVAPLPVIVLATPQQLRHANALVAAGAQDCVDIDANPQILMQRLQMSVARTSGDGADLVLASWRGEAPENESCQSVSHPLPSELANVTAEPRQDRRRSPRLDVTRSLYIIPVLPDGSPAANRQTEGVTVDMSREGLGFLVASEIVLNRRLVVGVEADNGAIQFATVEVRHTEELRGMTRYGAEILRGERDPLRDENLRPHLNPANHQLELGLPRATLEAWEASRVSRRVLVGRGYVCPDCWAIPLVRNGCKACGSARLTSSRLIHHYACAHVDHLANFQSEQEIKCPKCRAHSLIAGTDFEYLNGPYQCLGCGWNDTEFETVGHCLQCDLRFPIHQASEEDFIGFHIERLDPMACIGAS